MCPDSTEPMREVQLTIQPLARGREDVMPSVYSKGEVSDETRVPKPFYGLIYASGDNGYDRVRICRSRSGDDSVADLGVGEWSEWWLDTFEIEGTRSGRLCPNETCDAHADSGRF